MKKSIICMFLAVVMVLTMSASAFAASQIGIPMYICREVVKDCDCDLCMEEVNTITPYPDRSVYLNPWYVHKIVINGNDLGYYAFLKYGKDVSNQYLLMKINPTLVQTKPVKPDQYDVQELIKRKFAPEKVDVNFVSEGFVQCAQEVRIVPNRACKFDLVCKNALLGTYWVQKSGAYDLAENGFLWELTDNGFRLVEEETTQGGSIFELLERLFGRKTKQTTVSMYTAEPAQLQPAFAQNAVLYLNCDADGKLFASPAPAKATLYEMNNQMGKHDWKYIKNGDNDLCLYRECKSCGQVCNAVNGLPYKWFVDEKDIDAEAEDKLLERKLPEGILTIKAIK